MTRSGSCLCGAIRYEIVGVIVGINYCHCRQCRKASGTAFATDAAVDRVALRLLKGAEQLKGFQSSPGKTRYFCGDCGSPIYSHAAAAPGRVYVRIGSLDQDDGLSPDVHIHVESKAPWYAIADSLPQRQGEEDLWF